MRRQYIVFIWCMVALAAALLPGFAQAHGGGVPVITGAEAGGYRVYVWADPAAPRAGDTVHVTVGVTRPGANADTETPVTDAAVTVRFISPNGGAPLESSATPGVSAGSLYYEADQLLAAGGNWQVAVIVAGAQGSGENAFALAVGDSKATGYLYIILGIVIVGLGIGLFVRQSRRARARPGQAAA